MYDVRKLSNRRRNESFIDRLIKRNKKKLSLKLKSREEKYIILECTNELALYMQ